MSSSDDNLIWLDMEMSGLNTETDKVLEIATVVTDPHLNIIAEGPVIVIHQTDEILTGMDTWNQSTHLKSGLIERVKKSSFDENYASEATIEFLKNILHPINLRCAAIQSVKIDVLWQSICPIWKVIFIIEI